MYIGINGLPSIIRKVSYSIYIYIYNICTYMQYGYIVNKYNYAYIYS